MWLKFGAKCFYYKEPGIYRVEQGDTEVLDDAVESHELENTEGRDEGSSTLSVDGKNRRDIQD